MMFNRDDPVRGPVSGPSSSRTMGAAAATARLPSSAETAHSSQGYLEFAELEEHPPGL